MRMLGLPELEPSCFYVACTGQERKELPFAQHTACTIEMTNLQKRVDVAVIDEIQVSSGFFACYSCLH